MSDQQKIWFIYLTDHHEGPFTADEIAGMAKNGQVTAASLAWKDGMAEWVPAETIPELNVAIGNALAVAAVGAADMSGVSKAGNLIQSPASEGSGLSLTGGTGPSAPPETDGEVSLAQLLANQQNGGKPAEANTNSGQIADSASVLSSMMGQVQKDNPVTSGSGVILGGATGQTKAPGGNDPAPNEEAWTLKIGAQVSGLHSLNRLKELASAGEIPPDAMVWHPGWSDFRPVSSVASIDGARKSSQTKTGTTRPNFSRPGIVASGLSNAAAGDDDEPTDTGIEAPPPKGFKGVLFKIHKFAEKLKKKKAAKTAASPKGKVALAPAPTPGKAKIAGKAGGALKRVLTLLFGILLLSGGGAGAYWFLLRSPLPSDLDVNEEDRERMTEVVKQKPEAGAKLFLGQAIGSEDSPADPTAPKYYVATNLAEGAAVTLQVTGVAGTLVNRVSFEKTFTTNVDKAHLAVFDKINDEGKPLWGEFNLKATAEGAEPAEVRNKFIGNKGGSYQTRLKQFKESVQGEYDKEVDELRQFITTLKTEQANASRLVKEYKDGWATPANRNKITTDWTAFTTQASNFLGQIEQKLKERLGGGTQPKHHTRAFQDVSTTVGQLQQLIKAHGERLGGSQPSANPDELEGLVQAGVQALESWLGSAVSKSPFDANRPAGGGSDSAPKTTPPSAPSNPAPSPAPASTGGALPPAVGQPVAPASASPVPATPHPAPAPGAP